jgi:hypothetical protein
MSRAVRIRMNKEDYESVKKALQSYLDDLWKNEEKNEFLIWTESDAQSYLYSRLANDHRFRDKYAINNRPVLSSINPDKKYIGKAKNVKPFYQPDFLITPIGNLGIEKRKMLQHSKRGCYFAKKTIHSS